MFFLDPLPHLLGRPGEAPLVVLSGKDEDDLALRFPPAGWLTWIKHNFCEHDKGPFIRIVVP